MNNILSKCVFACAALPVFLIAGSAICGAQQAATTPTLPPIDVLQSATTALAHQLTDINNAVAAAPPEIQSKVHAVQQPSNLPNNVLTAVAIVDEGQRKLLANAVQSFELHAEGEEQWYHKLTLGSIFLSAGLALIGSIASFLGWNRTAGVIGLIVVSIVSLSNAYPVAPLENFYGDLTSQAKNIVADCTLQNPYTLTTYQSDFAQYKLLLLTEEKRPSFGKFENPSDMMKSQIQMVKIAAQNADTAMAATDRIFGFTAKAENKSDHKLM